MYGSGKPDGRRNPFLFGCLRSSHKLHVSSSLRAPGYFRAKVRAFAKLLVGARGRERIWSSVCGNPQNCRKVRLGCLKGSDEALAVFWASQGFIQVPELPSDSLCTGHPSSDQEIPNGQQRHATTAARS